MLPCASAVYFILAFCFTFSISCFNSGKPRVVKAKREMKKDLLPLKRTKGADIKIDDKPGGKSLMK